MKLLQRHHHWTILERCVREIGCVMDCRHLGGKTRKVFRWLMTEVFALEVRIRCMDDMFREDLDLCLGYGYGNGNETLTLLLGREHLRRVGRSWEVRWEEIQLRMALVMKQDQEVELKMAVLEEVVVVVLVVRGRFRWAAVRLRFVNHPKTRFG